MGAGVAIFTAAMGLYRLAGPAVVHAPVNRRGAANATFYMAMDIAIGLGGYFWGVTADVAGTRMVYLGTALVVSGVTAYTWFSESA